MERMSYPKIVLISSKLYRMKSRFLLFSDIDNFDYFALCFFKFKFFNQIVVTKVVNFFNGVSSLVACSARCIVVLEMVSIQSRSFSMKIECYLE